MRATQGANTTPQDLMNQGMNPRNIPSGMPTSPASFTGGMGGANAAQITPEVMSRIVDSAFETGVMAQVDFDQLLATQPPENRQAFTDAFRRANVTLQADAPSLADSGMGQQQMAANPVQRPQAGFAVMRGPTPQSRTANLGGDMPMMRNTEAQYIPVQPRNREVSPIPGIYNVSPGQVAATSRATRPSKQEEYDAELAKIRAARDAGPEPLTPLQKNARKTEVAQAYSKTQALIDKAYNPKEGVITLANKIQMHFPTIKRKLLLVLAITFLRSAQAVEKQIRLSAT
jgi:hypothetical protein